MATTSVSEKNAAVRPFARRARTRAPKARISTAVIATGIAYAENAYAPGVSADIPVLLAGREREYCRRNANSKRNRHRRCGRHRRERRVSPCQTLLQRHSRDRSRVGLRRGQHIES